MTATLNWPDGKRIAVVFNICMEAWSEGKAPGINPMGNPLPPQALDLMAISWAAYGTNRGIYRLLAGLARHGARASVAVNGIIAAASSDAVRAVADAGHEIVGHSWAMDVIPGLMSEEQERGNIERCTVALAKVTGAPVTGWLSPRATPSAATAALLADAGYAWHGDTLSDDLPYLESFGDRDIVAIPLATDVNDMPSMKYGAQPAQMVDSFVQNLEAARAANDTTIVDVTTHAHIFGRPRGAYFYDKIVEIAASSSDVWIATRGEIAEHFRRHRSQ